METPRRHVLIFIALGVLTCGGLAFLAIRHALVAPVEKALRDAAPDRRPLGFAAIPPTDPGVNRIGSGETTAAAFAGGRLWLGGGGGVSAPGGPEDAGLPTPRASWP